MSDLISRADVLKFPIRLDHYDEEHGSREFVLGIESVMDYVESLPSVEKRGRWIQNDNGTYSCSLCQSWIPEEQHCYAQYCLYCGARMEENDD